MEPLPESFKAAVRGAWPAAGPPFLAALPELIREFEIRWDIRALAPFPLSYNYVAPALRTDGAEVVLKLGVPNPELTAEAEALRLYAGRGAAILLAADPARGALLLERVRPGEPLATVADDDAATLIAAGAMAKLWRPLPPEHPFPDLRRWTRALRQYAERQGDEPGPLPARHVQRASATLSDLLAFVEAPVLIHGDFHHWNLLRAEREPWLAIDPKGVAAEPAFEIGPLLYNPVPTIFTRPDLAKLTERRLDLLAERLGLDRKRLLACATVAAALSACWSLESGDAPTGMIGFIGILAELDGGESD